MKNEIKVGILALISFVLIFLSIVYIGKCTVTGGGVPYRIQFTDLDDLKKGALVKFAGGLSVGYVKDIYRRGEKAEILVWIENSFEVTTGCSFIIRSAGVLGEKYIKINYTAGTKAPKNHLFEGLTATSIGSILVSAQEFIKKSKDVINTINSVLGGGDPRHIRNSTSSIAGVIRKLNVILAQNTDNIQQTMSNITNLTNKLQSTVAGINTFVAKLNTNSGPLGMLVNDQKLKKDLKELIVKLKSAADKLNKSSFLNPRSRGPRW